MAVSIGHNHHLGEAILAGLDAFLIASIHDPCGVVKTWGGEFGIVPIVHSNILRMLVTNATEESFGQETATGIVFDEVTPQALLEAVGRTLNLYADKNKWNILSRNNREHIQEKSIAFPSVPMRPLASAQDSPKIGTATPLQVLDTLFVRPDETASPRIEFRVGDLKSKLWIK